MPAAQPTAGGSVAARSRSRSGSEHFRNGEVALTVHGSGEVDVVQLRSGAERDWHARLADDRLRALADELAELDVAGAAAARGRPRPRRRSRPRSPCAPAASRSTRRSCGTPTASPTTASTACCGRWQALTEEVTDGALPYGEPR